MTSLNQSGDTQFTVFIRLPFPRGDFVDPPPVEWNAAKDQALWDILSRPSKGDGLDWKALADHFEVTLQFLLQQAAWLYDRQLSQVRAQILKVGTTQSSSPSPAPGSVSNSTALGQLNKGSTTSVPRAPSRLAGQQKDTPPQRAPIPRRTSSATTVNQVKGTRESHRNDTPVAELREPRRESHDHRPSISKHEQVPAPLASKSPAIKEDDLISSSSESESSDDDKVGSRRGLRFKPPFGKFSTHKPGLRDDLEDEDDESPAFLPEPSNDHHHHTSKQDLSATLRTKSNAEDLAASRRRPHHPASRTSVTTESSASSTSSGVPVTHPLSHRHRPLNQSGGPTSPRRPGDMAPFSPRRSLISGRETSDGTPSMGSSFSDLDDASVTQSALEEALMSNMQHGGMASRMSTFSQAIRSRYLGRTEDRFS
ncbi:autophagy-related protein 29 [Aspergillus heteromorphus CBS 117.55]|uniref:Autophagy-related protein 29 n=1 Tax=Aspergillus heteromorphus CBS 117.55 TaxID=1448321 RepID=A0A317X3E0_9EURO|nr:autophagy-related protein 29 [Aspergillus heteromorphus CBS 117.55]PWY92855.1 autophagy-related protein 29 [Aspergillus heteromorphus CBS 117.55]